MEADVSQDFQDYWNEYRVVTYEEKSSDEDHSSPLKSDDEGLDEAEWLVLAGLSHLTDSYLRGQEIEETELEPVMSVLSLHQANAVRRRVHSLNQTIKHRPKTKQKKPDIRDVFKNVEVSIEVFLFDIFSVERIAEYAGLFSVTISSFYCIVYSIISELLNLAELKL